MFNWSRFFSSILVVLFRDTPLGYLCLVYADSQIAKIVKNSQIWLSLAIWLSTCVQWRCRTSGTKTDQSGWGQWGGLRQLWRGLWGHARTDSIPCNQPSESCWAIERKTRDDKEWGWRAGSRNICSASTSGSADSQMSVCVTFGPPGGARPWDSCSCRETMASSWSGEEVEERGAGTQPGSGPGTSGLQNRFCQDWLIDWLKKKEGEKWYNDTMTESLIYLVSLFPCEFVFIEYLPVFLVK